jgi:DNA-binding transcriptional MocR family regulator
MRRAEVQDRLRELIDARARGDPIPSERTLSELLQASRPTVHSAINDLARTGLLVRLHGRGTFTSPHKISQEVPSVFGEPVPRPAATGPARCLNSAPNRPTPGINADKFVSGSLYRRTREATE